MKYYSEKLDEIFDSIDELQKAEAKKIIEENNKEKQIKKLENEIACLVDDYEEALNEVQDIAREICDKRKQLSELKPDDKDLKELQEIEELLINLFQ